MGGVDSMERRLKWINAGEDSALEELQLALLKNGFRNLRPGGTLVYSTCSFARRQNENLVAQFLASDGTARPVPLFDEGEETESLLPFAIDGEQRHMARFDPVRSNTSGLFI